MNQKRICEMLIDFAISKDDDLSKIEEWVGLPTKESESLTALHFASLNGNLALIKLLMKHGGKVEETTSAGLNMIHVSAQGNSPASTLFFMNNGL